MGSMREGAVETGRANVTTMDTRVLSGEELSGIDAWWRAANYLAVGMLYLQDNPLLKRPLEPGDIKARILGHWGSDPGQSFVWVHLNRAIRLRDLDMIYISGPGHGAPAVLANAYLEGTYAEVYPDRSLDEEGMRRLFRLFSFPGGVGSHCTPETPGSIHEGGELGYSLSHAFGAAFDNPGLIVSVVVGDGEAETGPLAAAWHANKFLNPARDGAVLPILHLNGYKIANPTILARIPEEELLSLFRGYGYTPYLVSGDEPMAMHQKMAAVLDQCLDSIRDIQARARAGGAVERPRWPMIILRTPKGWTAPKTVGGHHIEDFWRAHQVPVADVATNPEHLRLVDDWLKSYRPKELFDGGGRLLPHLRALAPTGIRRMSANPHANGGLLRQPLRLPDYGQYAVPVARPGTEEAENTAVLGMFLRDIIRSNGHNFRLFGPDETASNRLQAVYEATDKSWMAELREADADGGLLSPDGRVMEILSEHTVEGWLEGYLLTGRHGLLNSYEAFVHVIDSMVNQHAKWLEKARDEVPWRAPVASLNILLSSTVWRQDHNGFTHQDPGFLDVVSTKRAGVVRIYLPPDANCLLSVADHCLSSTDYVNVIVADKQPHLQYLDLEAARIHCAKGIGLWEWAGSDAGGEPDLVMAGIGDVATMEALAAAAILRQRLPGIRVRFVNVVDLYKLQPPSQHPHGLPDRDYDSLFPPGVPTICNFHGYPALVHKLAYRRANHADLHVHGYREAGSINTPLELALLNGADRFHLAINAIDRLPRLGSAGAHTKEWLKGEVIRHLTYAREHGIDPPEIRNWRWPGEASASSAGGPGGGS